MSSVIELGTFERVELRKAWPTEDGNFTPWLAEQANIELLGAELDIDLEVEDVEHNVGAFRADILARAIDEVDHRVIIENQFGRTNHNHLGQILTYLAGVEGAKTIVWIAETIQPDHRAAIDWLNANTIDEFSFFAIEIELWRIGQSPPAPRFKVVASPNDWVKSTRTATREAGNEELRERHHIRIAYWASFSNFLKESGSQFKIRRTNKGRGFDFSIGRSGIVISATISFEKKRIGVELYNHRDQSKVAFNALFAEKEQIEKEFGEHLDWQELPGKKATRIALYKYETNPADPNLYVIQHQWMLERMNKFKAVFVDRVRNLDLSTPILEEDN